MDESKDVLECQYLCTVKNHSQNHRFVDGNVQETHSVNWKQNNMEIPKFHELLYILDDMERFGAPVNFNAQRPESLLIFAATQPGRRAQKRHDGSKFELQSSQRLTYSLMIDSMYICIWELNNISTDPTQCTEASVARLDNRAYIQESTGHATFGTLWIDEQFQYQLVWKTSTHKDLMQRAALHLLNVLLHCNRKPILPAALHDNSECCFLIQCHPCFSSSSEEIHDSRMP